MRVTLLLVYLSVGVMFVAVFLPMAELRKSRGKGGKGVKGRHVQESNSPGQKVDKRTREIISDVDNNHVKSRTGENGRIKHGKHNGGVHEAHSNSGKRLRGSKRQKKKEKKKNKSKEKEPGTRSPSRRGRKSPEKIPSQQKDESQSLLSKLGDKVLSSFVLHEESSKPYRSDKLQCSDRLNRNLVKFYEEEVRIEPGDMATARSIITQFVKQIWPYIISNMEGLQFSGYRLVGSMAEDLGAVELSDFDFHLPLKFLTGKLRAEEIEGLPGYQNIICDYCESFVEMSRGQPHLSPALVLSRLQGIVQKAVDGNRVQMIGDCYQYRPGYKGPTVTIEIDCNLDDQEQTLRIEFVPLVTTTDGQQFVAKKAKVGLHKNEPLSWRKSFSEKERDFINRRSSDDLSVLRLAKAIFHHREPSLNYVSSYLLKNSYCNLVQSGYDLQSKNLCDQLQDFFEILLKFAKQGNLPCCFEDSITLFSSYSQDTIKNLKNRLKNILDTFEQNVKKWISLPELKDEL